MFEGLKGLKGFKGLTGFKGSRIKLVESALQQRYNGFHCQYQKKTCSRESKMDQFSNTSNIFNLSSSQGVFVFTIATKN